MKTEEAAELIEAIVTSLRGNPSQFNIHYNVSAVGAIGIGGAGGHGIVGIANGPGVGVYASAPTTVQMQRIEQQANVEMNKEFQVIQQTLEAIIKDLRSQSQTTAKREGFVAQLKDSWLPNVVVTLVAAILGRVT